MGFGWCILGEKLNKERERESGGKVQTWMEGVNKGSIGDQIFFLRGEGVRSKS